MCVFKAVQTASCSFIVSVCPSGCLSDRIEELGSHWEYFHKICIGCFQINLLSLKLERKANTLHKDPHIFILKSPSLKDKYYKGEK